MDIYVTPHLVNQTAIDRRHFGAKRVSVVGESRIGILVYLEKVEFRLSRSNFVGLDKDSNYS